MDNRVRVQARDQHEERCADCGIALTMSRDRVVVCQLCGQPLCHDCAAGHAAREEAMICTACWESDSLTAHD